MPDSETITENQDNIIQVFIVDDHPFLIEGLEMVINCHPNFTVCGSATTVKDTLQIIKSCKPNILIADMQIKDESGIDLIPDVRNILPKIHILMISMHSEPYFIEKSLSAGANGYIVKSESTNHLIPALQIINSGNRYLSPEVEKRIIHKALSTTPSEVTTLEIERLTIREQEILRLYGKGKSTKEIASLLNISNRTVDAHKEHIKQKLNKTSMKEVLELAIEWSKLNAC